MKKGYEGQSKSMMGVVPPVQWVGWVLGSCSRRQSIGGQDSTIGPLYLSVCLCVCRPPHSICASVLPSPPLNIEVFLPPRRQLICAHTHILSSVYGNAVSRSAIKCTVMLV